MTREATQTETSPSFSRGDLVRDNRQGAEIEEVLSYNHPMVYTYRGRSYHHTKVVKVSEAVR